MFGWMSVAEWITIALSVGGLMLGIFGYLLGHARTSSVIGEKLAAMQGEIIGEIKLNKERIDHQAQSFGQELKKQAALTSDLRELMGRLNVSVAEMAVEYRRLDQDYQSMNQRVDRIGARVEKIDSQVAYHSQEIAELRREREKAS